MDEAARHGRGDRQLDADYASLSGADAASQHHCGYLCRRPQTPPESSQLAHASARHGACNLAAAGIQPEQIDYVFCTHMHVDHVGWNTRLQDGRWVPTFPNAKYIFARKEWQYW